MMQLYTPIIDVVNSGSRTERVKLAPHVTLKDAIATRQEFIKRNLKGNMNFIWKKGLSN